MKVQSLPEMGNITIGVLNSNEIGVLDFGSQDCHR